MESCSFLNLKPEISYVFFSKKIRGETSYLPCYNRAMSSRRVTISPYYFSWQKRVLDLSLSSVLLLTISPLLLIIGTGVLITSGWPILFFQKRTGKNTKPFLIIKFRTMYPKAHRDQKRFQKDNQSPFPTFKIHHDPRFVGIGYFLSNTGLDELPQLINVFKGEMSIVGPRPLPVKEAAKLPEHWQIRHKVKPGLISHWALFQQRHQSLDTWWQLEEKSLQTATLWSDIMLIGKTPVFFLRLLFQV